MVSDNQIIEAWQNGQNVTARWNEREIITPDFRVVFSEIQELGGIVSVTLDKGIWQVIIAEGFIDILSEVFRDATAVESEASSKADAIVDDMLQTKLTATTEALEWIS